MAQGRVETATVMFTDVAGSTALRARVGEDEAERLRLVHDAIVSAAVEGHEGTVVKHLGDGVMAAFAGAAGAVDAAVEIQQRLEQFSREDHGERLSVRIGLSVGDVTVEDGDYFGLPVVEAQRLEASAEPETIRCAELVKHLARGRGDHDFVDLGELELKGLGEPLSTCEIRWTPLAAATASGEPTLPPVLSLAGGMPFSGRSVALDELLTTAKRCANDGFATVLLAGEPGIGKTRLAHEVARRIIADGGQVVAGRCDEDVAVPFQALRTSLDWFIGQQPDPSLDRLGRFPGDLVRLVPDLGSRVEGLPVALDAEAEAERYRLLQAVESWLRAAAAEKPMLLVLDDLHWADKGTLLALQHVIREAPPGLFVLCTYRDTDVDRTHPLSAVLADLRRMPNVDRIPLTGLPADEIREFLERAGGHELDEAGEAFAQLVERETAGNPFFVSELLRHLTEDGILTNEDGRWHGDLAEGESRIPEGIREVVGRRLGRLGEETEAVLRAASVIGYEFGLDLLATVLGRPVDDVIDEIDRAVAANLAVEVGVDRFRFSHALVRETLHDELSSTRRARQHRKVAEAIETTHGDDLGAVVADLAGHWREATVGGDPTRAIQLSLQAGQQARDASAPETAATWFAGAIEMMDDDPDFAVARRSTLVQLADAQLHSGDIAHRTTSREAADDALAAGDVDIAVAALTLRWRTSSSDFDEADEAKITQLRRALAELTLDQFARTRLTAELAGELIFNRDITGRAAALEEFNGLFDSLPEVQQLELSDSTMTLSSFNSGRPYLERYLALTEKLPARPGRPASSAASSAFLPLLLNDRERLDRAYETWLPISDADEPFVRAQSLTWRVPYLVINGHLAEAAAVGVELVTLIRSVNTAEWFVYSGTTSLGIAIELGGLDDLLAGWERSLPVAHPTSATTAVTAWLRLQSGDRDGARQLLSAFDVTELPDDAGLAMAQMFMGAVAAEIGSAEERAALIGQLESFAGLHAATGGISLGAPERVLALLHDALGDDATADRYYDAALRAHEHLRSPTWTARSQLDWAESLQRRGHTDEAATLREAARTTLAGTELLVSRQRLAELDAAAR